MRLLELIPCTGRVCRPAPDDDELPQPADYLSVPPSQPNNEPEKPARKATLGWPTRWRPTLSAIYENGVAASSVKSNRVVRSRPPKQRSTPKIFSGGNRDDLRKFSAPMMVPAMIVPNFLF